MHFPSERVYREMRSENNSLWIVPANSGTELALLIKASSSAVKALIAGCPLNLLIGRKGPYLISAVRIFDISDAPILIAGCQREEEEHRALARFTFEKSIPTFLFNEMDVCLAWTNLKLAETHALQIAKLLDQPPPLYVGPFTPECRTRWTVSASPRTQPTSTRARWQ